MCLITLAKIMYLRWISGILVGIRDAMDNAFSWSDHSPRIVSWVGHGKDIIINVILCILEINWFAL